MKEEEKSELWFMNGLAQLCIQSNRDGGNTMTMFQSGPERHWKGTRVVLQAAHLVIRFVI